VRRYRGILDISKELGNKFLYGNCVCEIFWDSPNTFGKNWDEKKNLSRTIKELSLKFILVEDSCRIDKVMLIKNAQRFFNHLDSLLCSNFLYLLNF